MDINDKDNTRKHKTRGLVCSWENLLSEKDLDYSSFELVVSGAAEMPHNTYSIMDYEQL